MSDHSHSTPGQADHGHEPHGPGAHEDHGSHGVGKYIRVFVALCVLTTLSFLTYSDFWPFHETPAIGWAFMMAVSCSKALLVMLFFMHLKYEADWKYVLTIPATFMSVFLVLALIPDVGRRVGNEHSLYHYSPARLEHVGTVEDRNAMVEATKAVFDGPGGHHGGGHGGAADAGHGTGHHGATPSATGPAESTAASPTGTKPAR